MTAPQPPFDRREPTAAERARLDELRSTIASELPELITRNQLSKEAREEQSLSGALRDAIHRSDLPLETISQNAGLASLELDEFLTGERTLRSDVMDRIAFAIGFQIPRMRARA